MNQLFSILMLIVIAMPAVAATRTVTLSVPGMNCAACPITVKKALGNVPGVSRTEVSLDRREATVTFDDSRSNLEALTRATQDSGYPSTVTGGTR